MGRSPSPPTSSRASGAPRRASDYGFGYCGHGVGPSYLGGEILRDLVCGEETERTGLLFVRKHGGRYPVEPIRYVGAQLTRKESLWYDEGGDAGKDLTRRAAAPAARHEAVQPVSAVTVAFSLT